jgi:hypothetical protein
MGNLDARVGHLEGRMLEQSEGIADIRDGVARLDAKISDSLTRLDDKMSRQFIWTVGMLVTVLAAVVGGLLSQ